MRGAALGAALLSLALGLFAPPAAVATPAPRLLIRAVALPSHFDPADQADRYEILITNIGAQATATGAGEPLMVAVTPRANLVVKGISGTLWAPVREELTCSPQPRSEAPQCELAGAVGPDGTLAIDTELEVTAPIGVAAIAVEVQAGGTPLASEVLETPIDASPAPFAIESFSFDSTAADGGPEEQAGGHPYEQLLSFGLPNDATTNPEEAYRPARNPRVIAFTLPSGFLGNPLAAPRCPPRALEEARYHGGERVVPCPRASRIGLVTLFSGRSGGAVGTYSGSGAVSALYNLTPEAGRPAEFGFSYLGYAVIFYADLAFVDGRYVLRVALPATPILDLDAVALTLFGDPGARDEEPASAAAFLTNPDSCEPGAGGARLEIDSWEAPREWLVSEQPAAALHHCAFLDFSPRLGVVPRQTAPTSTGSDVAADTPTGFDVSVEVPDAQSPWSELPSPRLRDLALTFPPGVSISPAVANGLQACEGSGPAGIDLPQGARHPTEAGQGEEIGPDGLSHLSLGHCPAASTLGSVELRTPLLGSPLSGSLYLAAPACGARSLCTAGQAESGEMLRVYLEARGEGIDLKLPGTVQIGGPGAPSAAAGLAPGQVRVRFTELPDLPLSEVSVQLDGGPRAALATPQTCGPQASIGHFTSWSAPQVPEAFAASSFRVATGAGGGACAASEAAQPSRPALQAGTVVPIAGAYSPLTLELSRPDGSQRLGSLAVALPAGLLARLAGVGRCHEAAIAAAAARAGAAEAAAPECPASAEVGRVQIAAGPGATPLRLEGRAYLAGPYKGAPLSLAIITPALAGPFDLGTVVVRLALDVEETSARVDAVSDPIPQILAGIPLDIRRISLQLDRPGFTLNPTNCAAKQIIAAVTSTLGDVAELRNRFQVGACKALAFGPKLKLSLSGQTRRAGHPALEAVLTQPKGQDANIARTSVILPKGLSIAGAHIGNPCTRVQFNSTPVPGEGCPRASILGHAKVWTPLLERPEQGKVYLRANGGARELPDIVVALRGEIPIRLVGFVDSVRNRGVEDSRVRVRFQKVPDVPFSRFDLGLFGGKRGLLENAPQGPVDTLCAGTYRATVRLTGHNGKADETEPKVGLDCGNSTAKHHDK